MNRKRILFLALMVVLTLIAAFEILKEKPKGVIIKDAYVSFTETPSDSGLDFSYDKLKKIEQRESSAEVYLFDRGTKSIMVENKKYVELIDLRLDGKTLYITIKNSAVKEKIPGDEVGKVIHIVVEEECTNVVVVKKGMIQ